MLLVRLFGPLALELGGREIALPDRLHARLLLAYLALHPGPHARGDLAALLWPDTAPSSARASLRAAVASARRSVGDEHLRAGRDAVALADAWVDALAFRELLRNGSLEDALGLVRGGLLQGLDAAWVEAEREEHQELVDQALAVLASRAEEAGDLAATVAHTRRRVALDPLAEPPTRELMRLLDAAGDRASALGAYERLSARLRSELRIAPSRATRDLARRLRAETETDDPLSLPAAMLSAAAAATRIDAHADAAALYERAAAVIDESVASGLRHRCEALIGLGEARLRAGHAATVREPLLEAADVARGIGDGELLAAAAVGLSSVPFFPGDDAADETVIGLLHEALDLVPRAHAATRARLLACVARERYFVAHEGEVEQLAAEALTLARDAGDPATLGGALDTWHLALAASGDTGRRLQLAGEMIALGERAERPELCLRGHVLRGVDLLETGDADAMEREGARLETLSARVRRPAYRWWPALWRATRAIAAGRLDDGARLAGDALAVGASAFGEAAELEAASQQLWLANERGELGRAAGVLAALVERYPFLPVVRAVLAHAYADAGDARAARGVIDELAHGDFAALRRDAGWLVGAAALAQACATTSAADRARALEHLLAGESHRHAVSAHGSVWLGPMSGWLDVLRRSHAPVN